MDRLQLPKAKDSNDVLQISNWRYETIRELRIKDVLSRTFCQTSLITTIEFFNYLNTNIKREWFRLHRVAFVEIWQDFDKF